jgi:regulator of chromosome condensation
MTDKVPGITATFVAAGIDNSLAITTEGKVLTWGYSENYRTGLGTEETVEQPTEVGGSVIAGKAFTYAACRGQFSLLAFER